MSKGRFRIDDWTVVPDELLLISGDSEIKIEPKAMQVLELLASRAPDVVSLEEMIESVWAGTVVGDGAVYRAITLLRKSLGDPARNPAYIESISRKGYRLMKGVEFLEGQDSGSGRQKPAKSDEIGYLIIAVMPQAMNNRTEYLASSIGRYLSWAADVFKIQLWPEDTSLADYQINLIVDEQESLFTIEWELLELRTRTLVSASHQLPKILEQESQMASLAEVVADNLCEEIRRDNSKRIVEQQLSNKEMSYWELILSSDGFQGMEAVSLEKRSARLTHAMAMFPDLAPAYAANSDLVSWQVINGIAGDTKSRVEYARRLAGDAIERDRVSPYVLSRCGTSFARLGDYARGIDLCARSLELAPSSASRDSLARVYSFAGQPEEAIRLLKEIEQNLLAGQVYRFGRLVVPLVQHGALDEARSYSQLYVTNFPGDYYAWILQANLLMQFGERDAGISAWQEACRLAPYIKLQQIIAGTSRTYGRSEEQIAWLTDGLRQLESIVDA